MPVHDTSTNQLLDPPTNSNASPVPSEYLICQRSGFRVSLAEGLKKTWDGLWVRAEDWEARHPQDFVRGRPERGNKGSVSPEPPDQFLVDSITFALEDGDILLLEDGSTLVYEE